MESRTHHRFCPVTFHGSDEYPCACIYIEQAVMAERRRILDGVGRVIWDNDLPKSVFPAAPPWEATVPLWDDDAVTKAYVEGRERNDADN